MDGNTCNIMFFVLDFENLCAVRLSAAKKTSLKTTALTTTSQQVEFQHFLGDS